MSTTLHKEHGLNPNISQCVIGRKDKNELVLLGAKYTGRAPMHMSTSFEPCDECKEKYLKIGVLLLEAHKDEFGKPIVTGSLKVLKDKAFTRMFNVPIPPQKIIFLESDVFKLIKEPEPEKDE